MVETITIYYKISAASLSTMRRAHRAANGGSGLSTEAAESASDDFFDDSPRELRFKSSSTWDFQVSDNGVIKVGESGFKVFEGPKERSEFSEGQVARDRLVLDSTRVIGRGASSLVYFGTDGPTGRKCAVKVVNILDPQRRHQVGREIATFAKCMEWHCDTLVELLGVHRGAEGKVHIVLEYMDLGSLEDLMRPLSLGDVHDGRPLRPLTEAGANCGHPAIPERVLAAMGYQVLLGLKHLHMLHNLHRDIKPSNILINSRGEVKLTDLGVAWQLDHLDATVDSVVGSVRYMSPERLGGQPYGWQAVSENPQIHPLHQHASHRVY